MNVEHVVVFERVKNVLKKESFEFRPYLFYDILKLPASMISSLVGYYEHDFVY